MCGAEQQSAARDPRRSREHRERIDTGLVALKSSAKIERHVAAITRGPGHDAFELSRRATVECTDESKDATFAVARALDPEHERAPVLVASEPGFGMPVRGVSTKSRRTRLVAASHARV